MFGPMGSVYFFGFKAYLPQGNERRVIPVLGNFSCDECPPEPRNLLRSKKPAHIIESFAHLLRLVANPSHGVNHLLELAGFSIRF